MALENYNGIFWNNWIWYLVRKISNQNMKYECIHGSKALQGMCLQSTAVLGRMDQLNAKSILASMARNKKKTAQHRDIKRAIERGKSSTKTVTEFLFTDS